MLKHMVYIFMTMFKGLKLIPTKIRLEFYYQILVAVLFLTCRNSDFIYLILLRSAIIGSREGDQVGHRNKVMIFECSEE
jgi:hypothetical protein